MHSLENETQIQTKIGKVFTQFQTKTAQKTIPLLGRHIPYKGVPPGRTWAIKPSLGRGVLPRSSNRDPLENNNRLIRYPV